MENVPIVYTLDDHDAGANNANGNDASTKEANIAFRAVFPHFPIPKTMGISKMMGNPMMILGRPQGSPLQYRTVLGHLNRW